MSESSILYTLFCISYLSLASSMQKTITIKDMQGVVLLYAISNLVPDAMITAGLCILLCNRWSEVQLSRYVPICILCHLMIDCLAMAALGRSYGILSYSLSSSLFCLCKAFFVVIQHWPLGSELFQLLDLLQWVITKGSPIDWETA